MKSIGNHDLLLRHRFNMVVQNIDKKRFLSAGDSGIIVLFDDLSADDAIVAARYLGQIVRQCPDEFIGVRDAIPGLNNLLIQYDPLRVSAAVLQGAVMARLDSITLSGGGNIKHWQLPICYGGEYGLDLDDVAAATKLSSDTVISLHLGNVLTVAIMGFLPGLGYLKGVDERLYLPRKSNPRQHVPALSLGIAMDQSVIYPMPSPGGWNLIGRTPVRLFDPSRDVPVLFSPGDQVSFTAVESAEYLRLDRAAAGGEAIISPMPEMPLKGQKP